MGTGKPKRTQKGLRPNVYFDVCPDLPGLAAHWGLRNLLDEAYWRRSHYKGMKIPYGQLEYQELDKELGVPALLKLLSSGKDLVETVIDRLLKMTGAAEGKPTKSVRERWLRIETTLNARLALACALAGSRHVASIFAPVLPWRLSATDLFPCRIRGWLEAKRYDHEFGQPDLLLVSDRQLVMVEMKVRGNKGAVQKYDASQFVKYANLAIYAHEHLGLEDICHVILTPRGGQSPFLRPDLWIQETDAGSGRMTINLDGLEEAVRKTGWYDRLSDPEARSKYADLFRGMPVMLKHYDQLGRATPGVRESRSWLRAAHIQLDRLIDASEPAKRG